MVDTPTYFNISILSTALVQCTTHDLTRSLKNRVVRFSLQVVRHWCVLAIDWCEVVRQRTSTKKWCGAYRILRITDKRTTPLF